MTQQMTRQRTFALVTAGLLGAAALSACGSDDSRTVGSVAVPGLTPAASSGGTAASNGPTIPATATAVAPLQTVQGVLQRDDDDADDPSDADDRYDDFTVNGIEVDFGPSEWILTAPALQDYDGDGTAEPFATELDGLVGQQVTLQARDDDDDDDDDDRAGDRLDDVDVYEINGLALRGASGPAPWAGGPVPTGALAG
ncbi:hypothetical protein SAMN06264364_11461 [Quadrisphaera granulorum]|uniref:Uncharacterized protein n=1 Tax=Quadrisphaera granulorum TaxID=317664 RepID=A0A316A5I5_9ACTN|nr:hypothetical protein [Quadrisphaera granulorum]PWJ53166.1 hypothetical protein BXY45_11461 [Quadrisphaera granulorum]SZE97098.1 hypothetical protein SAMN06264364_11461 [Quadrisphaera granulorum]